MKRYLVGLYGRGGKEKQTKEEMLGFVIERQRRKEGKMFKRFLKEK